MGICRQVWGAYYMYVCIYLVDYIWITIIMSKRLGGSSHDHNAAEGGRIMLVTKILTPKTRHLNWS